VRRTLAAAAVHTLALLAGAATTASALLAVRRVAGPAPAPAVAAVCALAAIAVAVERRWRLPGSSWMVPREWARLGPVGHAGAFGFLLGTGVVTVLPSAAMYAVLVAAESAPHWWHAYAVMLCFGGARASMVIYLTARSTLRALHPVEGLDRLRTAVRRTAVAECLLAAALAVALMH